LCYLVYAACYFGNIVLESGKTLPPARQAFVTPSSELNRFKDLLLAAHPSSTEMLRSIHESKPEVGWRWYVDSSWETTNTDSSVPNLDWLFNSENDDINFWSQLLTGASDGA
jgi:hypothetical protein